MLHVYSGNTGAWMGGDCVKGVAWSRLDFARNCKVWGETAEMEIGDKFREDWIAWDLIGLFD